MPIEKKIIEASVAHPYVDVEGTLTNIIANHLGQVGFRFKVRSGWIETEYAGRKAYIKITADED